MSKVSGNVDGVKREEETNEWITVKVVDCRSLVHSFSSLRGSDQSESKMKRKKYGCAEV